MFDLVVKIFFHSRVSWFSPQPYRYGNPDLARNNQQQELV
jgi:hypothetical protein